MAEEENTNDAAPEEGQPKAKAGTKVNATGTDNLKGISFIGQMVGLLLLAGLFAISSTFTIIFFALGMLPSILAAMIDRGAGRFASRTVVACNVIGIMPYLFEIAQVYDRDLASKKLMADYATWVLVYGFAAVGMLLVWMIPQISIIIFTVRAEMRMKQLLDDQKALLEEWGEGITQGLDPRLLKYSNDNENTENANEQTRPRRPRAGREG